MPDPWPPSDRSISPIPKGKDRLFPSTIKGMFYSEDVGEIVPSPFI